MKVVLSMAVSLNGMMARENGQEDWLPATGWDEFVEDARKFGNFVMGRETYELVQKLYPDHNFDDVELGNKVIVTRTSDYHAPQPYTVVHSPDEAVNYLQHENAEVLFLIGGGNLNSEFFARNLIDEVWLTFNPYILGKGRPFVAEYDLDISLNLIDSNQLPDGRIRVRYSVEKV